MLGDGRNNRITYADKEPLEVCRHGVDVFVVKSAQSLSLPHLSKSACPGGWHQLYSFRIS